MSNFDHASAPDLRDLLIEWSRVWPEYSSAGKVNKAERAFQVIVNDIPSVLSRATETRFSDARSFVFKGSTGMASIAKCPWVRMSIGKPKKGSGVNFGYLFSANADRIYLNIGLKTGGENRPTIREMAEIEQRAKMMRESVRMNLSADLADSQRLEFGSIELDAKRGDRAQSYETSNVVAIRYDIQKLPLNDVLIEDFVDFIGLFKLQKFLPFP